MRRVDALVVLVVTVATFGAGSMTPAGAASSSSKDTTSHWAGVGELVVAKLTATGSKSGTPYQHTEVTVSSSKSTTVKVPMSASGMRLLAGTKPPVHDGVATFDVNPSGTTTQNVRSDFSAALPLRVQIAYQLNGKPVSASALAPTRHLGRKTYKSGTLKVTYTIANTTSESTNVSFEGFNGAPITQNVTDPQPIVGEVKVTFPKDATNIDAAKANLATGHSGVHATWSLALAPPLSSATGTVTYTDHLNKVVAPAATIEAEVVVPSVTPTGKAPAHAASALASAEGAAEQGLGGSPESLGQVHSDLNGPARATSSSVPADKTKNKKGSSASDATAGSPIATVEEKLNTLVTSQTNSLEAIQQNLTSLASSQANSQRTTNATSTHQVASLGTVALQAVASLAAELGPMSNGSATVVQTVLSQLSGGVSNLETSLATHLSDLASHSAAADAINSTVVALAGLIDNLTQAMAQQVSDSSALDLLVVKLISDANAFPPSVQSTAPWTALVADLTAAKAKADLVSSAAAELQQSAANIDSAMHQLQTKVAALDADAHNLEAEAATAAGTLSDNLTSADQGVDTTLQSVSASVGAFEAQVATQQLKIGTAEQSAQASITSASQAASATIASAKANAQNSAQQALDNAKGVITTANADYAQLLALDQIALAHQLPGGNAQGANVQNGAYVLRVAATG
ncbi:MAG TPA: hypothetical protein VI462_03180 [Acidimicrobiia bacterium]